MDLRWCYDHYVSHRWLTAADNIRSYLKRIMERNSIEIISTHFGDPAYYSNIRCAIIRGFFMHVAKKAPRSEQYYLLNHGQVAYLDPSDTVFDKLPECVIYNEYLLVDKTLLIVGFC